MVFDPGNLDSQRCNLRSKGHSGRLQCWILINFHQLSSRLLINFHQVSLHVFLFYLPFSTKSFTIGSQFFHVASWRWRPFNGKSEHFRYRKSGPSWGPDPKGWTEEGFFTVVHSIVFTWSLKTSQDQGLDKLLASKSEVFQLHVCQSQSHKLPKAMLVAGYQPSLMWYKFWDTDCDKFSMCSIPQVVRLPLLCLFAQLATA